MLWESSWHHIQHQPGKHVCASSTHVCNVCVSRTTTRVTQTSAWLPLTEYIFLSASTSSFGHSPESTIFRNKNKNMNKKKRERGREQGCWRECCDIHACGERREDKRGKIITGQTPALCWINTRVFTLAAMLALYTTLACLGKENKERTAHGAHLHSARRTHGQAGLKQRPPKSLGRAKGRQQKTHRCQDFETKKSTKTLRRQIQAPGRQRGSRDVVGGRVRRARLSLCQGYLIIDHASLDLSTQTTRMPRTKRACTGAVLTALSASTSFLWSSGLRPAPIPPIPGIPPIPSAPPMAAIIFSKPSASPSSPPP